MATNFNEPACVIPGLSPRPPHVVLELSHQRLYRRTPELREGDHLRSGEDAYAPIVSVQPKHLAR
jgi:hypothetical protein